MEVIINTIEVNKSKFIGYTFSCTDVEMFKTQLEEIKKTNKKASHVVYAYRVGVNSKSCDDGEPKGTAGRPLLELLGKKHLSDIAVIVVRYFGGSKLGASRLLRTYVDCGNQVLKKAGM